MHENWWHTRSFEDFFNSVVNIFVKAGIKDDEPNIDRVHSKGKQYLNKKLRKKCKVIFAKFASFSYRPKAYRQNKNLDDNEAFCSCRFNKKATFSTQESKLFSKK